MRLIHPHAWSDEPGLAVILGGGAGTRLFPAGLVRPNRIGIFVMGSDGSNKRQLTRNGAVNFAPFIHPNGRQIVFSSNVHDRAGRDLSLYMIDIDGGNRRRIRHHDGFDGVPLFSPDGSLLVFGSSRGAREAGEINVFVAEWRERPGTGRKRDFPERLSGISCRGFLDCG